MQPNQRSAKDFLSRFTNPMLIFVKQAETSMLPAIRPKDVVVIDRDEAKRRAPSFTNIYGVMLEGGPALRHCEVVRNELVMMAADVDHRPESVSLEDRDILDIVLGQAVWVFRKTEGGGAI